MNKAKCLQYRDTWAAPGSELYRILTEEKPAPAGRREAKALKHYQELEKQRRDREEGQKAPPRDVWDVAESGLVTCNGVAA